MLPRKNAANKETVQSQNDTNPKTHAMNVAYWVNTLLIFLNCYCYIIVKDYKQIFKPRSFLYRLSKGFTPLSWGTMYRL